MTRVWRWKAPRAAFSLLQIGRRAQIASVMTAAP